MNHTRTRVTSPAVVETIADANHVPSTHTAYAASVELGEVVYFWSAA